MSKITNILNMYRLLLESTCISPKDIASELELSVRQIKTYKSDMIDAGIPIKTKKGRGGGYYIDVFYDTSFKICHIDDDVLMDSINFLKEHGYIYTEAVEKILGYSNKGFNIFKLKNKKDSCDAIEKTLLHYPLINKAIKNNYKISMIYKALNNEVTKRVVYPLKLIEYLDSYYFIAYCTLRKENRIFKISRIQQIENLFAHFENSYKANLINQIDDSFGLYFGEKIDVELEVFEPFSTILREKTIVKNQRIVELKDNKILFKASMHGMEEILSWVLSMGSYVKVRGSDKLVFEYKKMLKEMLGNHR